MTFSAAEADRQIGNALHVGTVTAIDNATGRARVQIGDLLTPPLQVMQLRSGTIRMHWMPSVGEQVTIAAPSGSGIHRTVPGSSPPTRSSNASPRPMPRSDPATWKTVPQRGSCMKPSRTVSMKSSHECMRPVMRYRRAASTRACR